MQSILSKLAEGLGAGGLPPSEGKVAPADGHDFKEKPDYPAPDKPLNRLIFKDRKTVPDKEVKITKEGSVNEAFLQGLIDGLEKAAESYRSLGVTNPTARGIVAKSLRNVRAAERGGAVPKGLAKDMLGMGHGAIKTMGADLYNRLGRGELPKTLGEGKRFARAMESGKNLAKKYAPSEDMPSRGELFKAFRPDWVKLQQMSREERIEKAKQNLGM